MRFLLLLAPVVFFVACSKPTDNAPVLSNGSYKTATVANLKTPVMYTQGRQIEDSAIINSYLRYHSFTASFSYNLTEPVGDSILLLNVHNADSVSCWFKKYRHLRNDYLSCSKTVSGNSEFFIKSFDTVFMPVLTNIFGLCGYTVEMVCKYPEFIYYNQYPGSTAYYPIIIPAFPLIMEDGVAKLPVFAFACTVRSGVAPRYSYCNAYVSGINNIARENILDSIPVSDTLVIQEGFIDMIPY